jgi:hypothetical protein
MLVITVIWIHIFAQHIVVIYAELCKWGTNKHNGAFKIDVPCDLYFHELPGSAGIYQKLKLR